MLQQFEVGKYAYSPSGDGIICDIDNSGLRLIIKFSRPTTRELKSFESNLQYCFVALDNFVFLCFKFGYLNWMDAPIHKSFALNWTEAQDLSDPKSGLGMLFHLADASNGILLQQRLMGLDHQFSIDFLDALNAQADVKKAQYDAALRTVYMRYQSSDLAALARQKYTLKRS